MRKVFLILLILIIQFSCTKELDYELECTKSLVINSVFNPDDNFTFHISTTASTLEKYDTLKENIQLLLYENDYVIIDTMLDAVTFQSTIRPNSNIKYTVEISSNNFQSIIAFDSIPRKINIEDATLISPVGVDEYGDEYGEFTVKFTDPANEKNYYELAIYRFLHDKKEYYNWTYNELKVTDPVLINEGLLDYLPTTMFFSDELFNGETYNLKFKEYDPFVYDDENLNSGFYAELRSISESYYLYRRYYSIHAFNQQTNYEDLHDFLFSGEPQDMYTNVNNGYGIFVGYSKSTQEFLYIK